MKCTHCGSQWNSNTAVTECPFCHKPLNVTTDGPKTLINTLVQLRNQLGVNVMGNGRALISGFKDLAPELKKEYIMLTHLEKCDGIKTLYAARDKAASEQQLAVSKVVRMMADEYALQESAAQSVCRAYMQVLTGKEKETQEPNSETDLARFRQKLTERLREQVPLQMASPPKPAAPATPPEPAVAEFQTDANGKLLKYNGNASVVRVPGHVKIIGAKAFNRNPLITHIILPDGLISIEEEAFAVCPALRDVSFPSTLQSIGDKAFWACNMLREVTLPGSVKTIERLAFWACKGMTKVTLREGITTLGADAFNYCEGLKEINLPKSLKTVHPHAFTGAMDARVSGNSAWTVKEGHVVANTAADTTYRNVGTGSKTVIAPTTKQSRSAQPKPAEPPKSKLPPSVQSTVEKAVADTLADMRKQANPEPKPQVTSSKPPVTPEAAPASKPAKKKPLIMRLLGACMYLAWGAAFFLYLEGIEAINTDGSFYVIIPVVLALFLLGRFLFMKNRVFWGLFVSFCAAGNLIQFYEFSTDSTVNNVIMIAYPILCAVTSFCHGPIFGRFKK